jgi:nucleoside-diphosphate-sugar epimerase
MITGAEGFVGRELVVAMRQSELSVLAIVRADHAQVPTSVETLQVGDMRDSPDWSKALDGVDTVVHLAGRAHVIAEHARNPIEAFRAMNVAPTLKLFQACQSAGVRRFIFVSSIGVNGTKTIGKPFEVGDEPNPSEPYAVSKWEAEQGLRGLKADRGTDLVIVRPSLIYGPGAKGNFLRLLRLVHSGLPLPFGAVTAARSILSLAGFCDLLIRCVRCQDAAGQVFLAADAKPITTRDIVVAISDLMSRRALLISISPPHLNVLGRLVGMGTEVSRLTSSLEVDSSAARLILGWSPTSNFQYDMKRMVDSFLHSREKI